MDQRAANDAETAPDGDRDETAGSGPGRAARLGATALLQSVLDAAVAAAARESETPEIGLDDPTAADIDPQLSLGGLFEQMEERAHGLLLLLFALPCCLPFVYLLPQLVALPMIAVAGQMAAGRHAPWLPKKFRERAFRASTLQSVLDRSKRYVGWIEMLARPRLLFMTGHLGSRIVGALLIVPCASILVPLPSTNTVPGIGVAIASVGLLERDGLLVALGLIIGLAWVSLLVIGGPALLLLILDAIRSQT